MYLNNPMRCSACKSDNIEHFSNKQHAGIRCLNCKREVITETHHKTISGDDISVYVSDNTTFEF